VIDGHEMCRSEMDRLARRVRELETLAAKTMRSGNVCDLHPLTPAENGTVEGCAGCFGDRPPAGVCDVPVGAAGEPCGIHLESGRCPLEAHR
jgi:hypothetical protein